MILALELPLLAFRSYGLRFKNQLVVLWIYWILNSYFGENEPYVDLENLLMLF